MSPTLAGEAKRIHAKALKLLQPSVMNMRFKPDWDQATPLLEEAARFYNRAHKFTEAQHTYEHASTGQAKLGSELHACKMLEHAADCAMHDKRPGDAAELYKRGSNLLHAVGKAALAVQCLKKGAHALLDHHHTDLALEMLELSIAGLEEGIVFDTTSYGSMVLQSQEVFASVTKVRIDRGELALAAANELRMASFMGEQKGFESSRSVCRAFVNAVMLHLVDGNGEEAMATMGDCYQYDAFMNSTSSKLVSELIDHLRAAVMKDLAYFVKSSGILHEVDNAVARLLKKRLAADKALVDKLSAQIGSQGAANPVIPLDEFEGQDEDDLT